jgi:hypothetical protein
MGIIMTLPKEDSILYHTFADAYWSIDNIVFANGNGISYCSFEFNAYPSREAKHKSLEPVTLTLSHGGPIGLAYQSLLHQWQATFPTCDIFPAGIPVSESDQKDVLYAFVKSYLQLNEYRDDI